MTRDARGGVTLVEVLVGALVFFALLSILYAFWSGAAGGTARAVEASDALRSTLLATEVLRHDASRLFFQKQEDLVIRPDGRGLSMLIPEPTSDLWNVPETPVTYTLAPVHPGSSVHRLVRSDAHGARPVAGCLLRDLLVRWVPPGEVSAHAGYLEVTMIGLGCENPHLCYTGSALLPLERVKKPRPYLLEVLP